MLTPIEEILAWSKTQPTWRQDALRRILTKGLTEQDEEDCLQLLKAEHGFPAGDASPQPLEPAHLPARSLSQTNLRLVSLDQISSVNRLAKDAALSFAPEGITLIYGDNGSGKSGFTRILKKACRARDDESILPDVFGTLPAKPANAQFTVQEGSNKPVSVQWQDDSASPEILGRFAIFDSKCASVYVDDESRIEIVPHNLDCFERVAQLCDNLRSRLKAESDRLNGQLTATLPSIPEETAAHSFVTQLATKSQANLDTAAVWTDSDDAQLNELGKLLKDPAAESARLDRLTEGLTEFADQLAAAAQALSDEKMSAIATLRADATKARSDADSSAAVAFSGEALPGVGSDVWRALFDAAKVYSETMAYPGEAFPSARPDAHCVLCQQELDPGARDRFKRFTQFVTGAMNARANSIERARDDSILAIQPANLPIPRLTKECSDYLTQNDSVYQKGCVTFYDALSGRRTAALSAGDILALPADPQSSLRTMVANVALAAQAARALAGTNQDESKRLRQRHAELSGQKTLHDNKAELQRRIDVYADIAKLDKCMRACATKSISDHGGKLLKAHVTDTLASSVLDEAKTLGIQSIPLALADRTEKAVVQHRIRLDGATLPAHMSAVLSEGEHRAVALAVFFAELNVYPGKDAIIIDDPVSSLDHHRRNKVAERLAVESKCRQVIVFTHDLVFVSELEYYAGKNDAALQLVGIQRGPDGFGSLDPDGQPWLAKNIGGRRQWLEQQLAKLKKLHAAADESYERELRFFYDRLRESWERLIEERVFARVLSRFQPQVQTMRLKEAVIDEDIFAQIHFGMTAVSNHTGHDRPAAKGGALVESSECEQDLKDWITCLDSIAQKSKAAIKIREAKITPAK